MLSLLSLVALAASVLAQPSITLPLSRQVPPVARILQPFSFTLSHLTFTDPTASPIGYTTGALPRWLSFTPSNLTFSGIPTQRDLGVYSVMVVGSSPSGSVADTVAFAVSDKSGNVTVHYPVEDQLVSSDTAITSAFPFSPSSPFYPGVRVPPGWSFSLGFQPYTFTAPTKVFYSASLADGSPLPSWLEFNNATVTFDGVTPPVGGSYQIVVAGSDVLGFRDVKEAFNLTIATHEITLLSPPVVNLTLGEYSAVKVDLDLAIDGKPTTDVNVSIDTSGSWATWCATNNSIIGLATGQGQVFNMSAVDKYGDYVNSTLTVNLLPNAFKSADPVMARPRDFVHVDIGRMLSNADVNLTATFDPDRASSWLSLAANNSLVGMVPDQLDYTSVSVALKAVDTSTNAVSHSTLLLSITSDAATARSHHGLSTAATIALAIIASVVALLLLILSLVLRRRNKVRERGIGHTKELSLGDPEKYPYAYSASALETPAAEYADKMPTALSPSIDHEPVSRSEIDSLPQLSSGIASTKSGRRLLRNPFARMGNKPRPEISNPIVMPSFENAAFQAQLAAAVDSAGIVKRNTFVEPNKDGDVESQTTRVDSVRSGTPESETSGESSGFTRGASSRASWESEPPFVWSTTRAESAEGGESDRGRSEEGTTVEAASTEVSSTPAAVAVQRSDFRAPVSSAIPVGNGSNTNRGPMSPPHQTGDGTEEGISIDNIHFPTDSDIAHTETSSVHEAVVIATASRIDARRTLDSPVGSASPASSHTEKASPVMTTHSRLVSFGKQRMVLVNANDGARSVSQTAVVGGHSTPPPDSPLPRPPASRRNGGDRTRSRTPTPPTSLPSLPALPTSSTASRVKITPQRILLGVAEPFHFYPPLQGSSSSGSLGSTQPSSGDGAAEGYKAYVERGGRVEELPEWLRFEGGELWGVPGEEDRGVWEVRVHAEGGQVVGRFSLEVVGR